jgi:hypothetical protein
MSADGWNRYMFYALPRATRAQMVLRDVRGESAFIQKVTSLALENDRLDKPKEFDKEDSDFEF